MKIMIVIPTLGYGGAETLVLCWIREWLEAAEVSKVVLVLYSRCFLHRLGDLAEHPKFQLEIEDTNTPWRIFRIRYFLHLLQLKKIVKRIQPDVIHTNLVAGLDFALLRFVLSQRCRFVHTMHHPVIPERGRPFYHRLLRYYCGAKECCPVAISASVAQTMRQYYHVEPHLIFNGAGIPPETSERAGVEQGIRHLMYSNSSEEKRVFIAVGRVAPPKNYEMMTQVFQRLYQEKQPVMLVVLGDLIHDENRKKYLPMRNQNIFFLDRKNNVGDYLRCAEFFCMTSHFEGLSIGIIEAISTGLIPVITPTESLLEVVPDGKNGIISEDMSAESYYQAVRYALALHEDEKEKIRHQNRCRYEENFTMKRCAENYLTLFKETENRCGR